MKLLADGRRVLVGTVLPPSTPIPGKRWTPPNCACVAQPLVDLKEITDDALDALRYLYGGRGGGKMEAMRKAMRKERP